MMAAQAAHYDMSRFGMELRELSDVVAKSEFGIFRSTVAEGGQVKGI
jgi:aspartyl-tRNA synthetase